MKEQGGILVMIKVALCDDETADRDELLAVLNEFRTQRSSDMSIEVFGASLDLLNAIEHGARFDVLLLDILMPGFNGIETAAEIRRFDSYVKIIFLTSSSDFAVQSYTVNAFYYQLKPVESEFLFRLLDSVLETCKRERSDNLILQCKDGLTPVEISRIEFCEVMHRTLFIHMTSGKVFESTGSLDNFEKQLSFYGCFMRIHRSYIVNLNHVRNISPRAVTMSCLTEIPIPRGKHNEIKNAFLENAFCEGKVEP